MSSHIVFVLFTISCVSAQQWSEWTPVSDTCSEECGMCGTRKIAQRTCVSGTCVGEPEQKQACGEKLCVFPKKTCCDGFKKGINLQELIYKCIPM